ncbi:DUF3709 domain-containing protein [Vibrio cholerae]|uniref:DUF3709 domain-containing protein n=1 Tax=Vibrio cholerae TaxID=666 RepID=UPI00345A132F
MRCQPLRRALCLIHKKSAGCDCQFLWHFVLVLSAIQYCFRCLMKRQCVWRCKF